MDPEKEYTEVASFSLPMEIYSFGKVVEKFAEMFPDALIEASVNAQHPRLLVKTEQLEDLRIDKPKRWRVTVVYELEAGSDMEAENIISHNPGQAGIVLSEIQVASA